jgi:hypothetical protein
MISFSLSDVAMRRTIFVDIQTAMATMDNPPRNQKGNSNGLGVAQVREGIAAGLLVYQQPVAAFNSADT